MEIEDVIYQWNSDPQLETYVVVLGHHRQKALLDLDTVTKNHEDTNRNTPASLTAASKNKQTQVLALKNHQKKLFQTLMFL